MNTILHFHQQKWEFPLFHVFTSLLSVLYFRYSINNRCAVVSHYCFNLLCFNDFKGLIYFHLLLPHPYIFFGKMLALVFFLIYWVVYIPPARFWVLHVVHQSFYQMSFFRYFLPVCDLSFHSLKSVFHRAKVFYFNKVQVLFCFFIVLLMLYLNLRAFLFFPVASRSLFLFLSFAFMSIIYFFWHKV